MLQISVTKFGGQNVMFVFHTDKDKSVEFALKNGSHKAPNKSISETKNLQAHSTKEIELNRRNPLRDRKPEEGISAFCLISLRTTATRATDCSEAGFDDPVTEGGESNSSGCRRKGAANWI